MVESLLRLWLCQSFNYNFNTRMSPTPGVDRSNDSNTTIPWFPMLAGRRSHYEPRQTQREVNEIYCPTAINDADEACLTLMGH